MLQKAEAGIGVPGLCRKDGVSKAISYNLMTKYVGMIVSDLGGRYARQCLVQCIPQARWPSGVSRPVHPDEPHPDGPGVTWAIGAVDCACPAHEFLRSL